MTFQCPPLVNIRLWENRCPISISASQMVLCFREWFYQACLLPRDPSSDPIFCFMRIFFSFMRLFSFMRICCYSFPTDLLKEYNLEANVTHFLPVHRMFFFPEETLTYDILVAKNRFWLTVSAMHQPLHWYLKSLSHMVCLSFNIIC